MKIKLVSSGRVRRARHRARLGLAALVLPLSLAIVVCGGKSSVNPPSNPQIKLWVADTKNNRVLGYQAPASDGDPAVVVIGQPAFGPTACNSPALTAATLCGPVGTAIDAGGNLWIADTANNRVLEFAPPFSDGQSAALVIGKPGFTTGGACSPSATSICSPRSVVFDRQGNLWVSDANGNRVLQFASPFSNGMPASIVLGQGNFVSSFCGNAPPSATGMCSPAGLAFDSKGNLFVSDSGNSRVLMFAPPFSIGMPANLAIGQISLTSNNEKLTQFGLSNPFGIGIDGSDNIFVADSGNSRIMIFPPPTASGENATVVLGNTNFTSLNPNACGPNIDGGTLCKPLDVKVDGGGNTIAVDQNNRTVIFRPQIITGELASVVLGQPSLTAKIAPTGLATSQNGPAGLAVTGVIVAP